MRKLIIFSALLCVVLCIGRMNGGWQTRDFDGQNNETDAAALAVAVNGVQAHLATANEVAEFQGVERCQTQVVAGVKYRLLLNYQLASGEVRQYEVVVYLVPWEGKSEVQSVTDVTATYSSADLNVNSYLREDVLRFLDKEVKARVNRNLDGYWITNFKVLGTKVVQGNVYDIVVDFTSPESSVDDAVQYRVSVWSRPWVNPPFELVDVTDYAQKTTLKAGVDTAAGSYTQREWNAEGEMEKAILAVLTEYGKEKIAADFAVTKVENFQIQVVSGIRAKATVTFVANGETKTAQTSVYLRPWDNYSQVVDFTQKTDF